MATIQCHMRTSQVASSPGFIPVFFKGYTLKVFQCITLKNMGKVWGTRLPLAQGHAN